MSLVRPIYETTKDLQNEEVVRQGIEFAWSCKVKKLPIRYEIDWALFRDNQLCAYAEFKQRSHRLGDYPTFILSHQKWVTGKTLANEANVPFLVIVRFKDQLAYCETKNAVSVSWAGREDRNDPQDLEPVVHIPHTSFKVIR
jgi:hypothetical protein